MASKRSTIGQQVFERLRGINQRAQFTIVPQGYATRATNILFGLDGTAERLSGKLTKLKLTEPILNIRQLNEEFAILQTLNHIYRVDLSDLLS